MKMLAILIAALHSMGWCQTKDTSLPSFVYATIF